MSRTKREIGETPAKEGTFSQFTDKRKYKVLVKSLKTFRKYSDPPFFVFYVAACCSQHSTLNYSPICDLNFANVLKRGKKPEHIDKYSDP